MGMLRNGPTRGQCNRVPNCFVETSLVLGCPGGKNPRISVWHTLHSDVNLSFTFCYFTKLYIKSAWIVDAKLKQL